MLRKIVDFILLDDLRLMYDFILYINYHKKKIIPVVGTILLYFLITNYMEYNASNSSSDEFLEYIDGKNEKFLNKKQSSKYEKIKLIILEKKTREKKTLTMFAQKDDFIFKNLLNLAKKFEFCAFDEYDALFECEKNPWHKLFLTAKTFCKDKNYTDTYYSKLYLMSKGKKY